jgi:hypothetical protein
MGRGEAVGPLGAADMARGVGNGLGDVSGFGVPRVIPISCNTYYVIHKGDVSKIFCRQHEEILLLEYLAAFSCQARSYPC